MESDHEKASWQEIMKILPYSIGTFEGNTESYRFLSKRVSCLLLYNDNSGEARKARVQKEEPGYRETSLKPLLTVHPSKTKNLN